MENNHGGLLTGGIIVAVIIAILAFGKGSSFIGALGKSMLLVGIIAAILLILLVIIVFSLAVKSSKEDAKNNTGNRTSVRKHVGQLKSDEEELLVQVKRNIGQLRVLLTKVKEEPIRRAGEKVCKQVDLIIADIKNDPKDMKNAKTFLTSYVPTLAEILEKYLKLEQNGMADESMKKKVVSHLGDIQGAAEKLYQNLFADDMLDLTVEMKALRIACKSDGLIDDGLFQFVDVEEKEEESLKV